MPTSSLQVDVTLRGKSWTSLPAARLCTRAAKAAYAAVPARRRPKTRAEVAILLTSDAAIRRLNATYRRKDKATDVLSFPGWSPDDPSGPDSAMLGDVVIAYGTSARDAKAASKALSAHLMHLVVHGVLHVLGYDHIRDRDAAAMERLEISVLKALGVANPYKAKPTRP